jgi:hypothetical protein
METRFDVDLFSAPHLVANGPANWAADEAAMVEAMSAPCHVLTWASSISLLAAARSPAVRSYTTLGLLLPPGTLKGQGRLREFEVLTTLQKNVRSTINQLRPLFPGSDETTLRTLADDVDSDVDFQRLRAYFESLHGLDLSQSTARFEKPALLLSLGRPAP